MSHPLRLRRFTVAVAAGTALLLAAAACGSTAAPGPTPPTGLKKASELVDPTSPVTITYAGAAYSADQLKPVFDAFHAAHPTITVEYQSVPFDQFNSTLSTRLGNRDQTLDLFDVDMPRTDAYQARGWLTDLTPVFGDLSGQVDAGSQQAASVSGKLVALPYQTSSQLMYYNKKLLTAAGVSFPSNDPTKRMTWEDVTDQATKAKAAGAKWGVVFDQIDRYYQLQPLPESLGGGPGGSGAKNLTPQITNDAWVKAFTWYGSLFKDGLSPRGVPAAQTPDLFAAGQVAFFPGGPWWATKFTAVKDLDFGVTAYPAFAGGKAVTPTGGWSLGLNPASKKAEAALIFMKYFGLDGGGFAKQLSGLAVPPANVAGSQTFYNQAVFTDPRMAGTVALVKNELATTATLRLRTVGYVEFEDVMTKAFSDIINGTSADAALKSASTELDQAWAKYK
jgi:multiple sugar transport system substrate-binding protein